MAKERKDPIKAIKAFHDEAERIRNEQETPYWKGKVNAFARVIQWFDDNPESMKPVTVYKINMKQIMIAFVIGQVFQAIITMVLSLI